MGDDGYEYRMVIKDANTLFWHWVVGSGLFTLGAMAVLAICNGGIGATGMALSVLTGMAISAGIYHNHWTSTASIRNGTSQSFDDPYIRSRYRDGTLRGNLWKTADGRRFIEVTAEFK